MAGLFLLLILKGIYELLAENVTLFKESVGLGRLLAVLNWLSFAISHCCETLFLYTVVYQIFNH